MSPTNAELRQFIMGAFNDEELVTLCADCFPEVYQNFSDGLTKNRKALALIGYCDSRGLMDNLVATLAQGRPAAWQKQFAAPEETFRRNVSTPTTATPNRRIHAKTGIELIRIPAGPFQYGWADSNKVAHDNEKPQRTINLPEYWIGRAPVTNMQFARFVKVTSYRTAAEKEGSGRALTGLSWEWVKGADWRHPAGPESHIQGKDDHPMVQVSWEDAYAFCDWAGLQLPSEQEWEKAARGADGRIWPWGDDPPTADHCNSNRNVDATTPVGRYSPCGDSPYGCVDMAGNVWEWTASWYRESTWRAVRGGSWLNHYLNSRAAYRNGYNPNSWVNHIGFRVAEYLSDPDS